MWSWMPYNLKSTFIRMFKDGHANPNARPRLAELQANIEDFLMQMNKEPELTVMAPNKPKSKCERKGAGTFVKHKGNF